MARADVHPARDFRQVPYALGVSGQQILGAVDSRV